MEEYHRIYLLVAGAALIAASAIWLLVTAFRPHVLWGLSCLVLLGLPFFLGRHWPRARRPVGVLMFGAMVFVAPFAINRVQQYFIDFGPREKMVEGELHITLTGWDRTDYAVLRARPATVVLQLANPDVTDETLDYLTGMIQLRDRLVPNRDQADRAGVRAETPAGRDVQTVHRPVLRRDGAGRGWAVPSPAGPDRGAQQSQALLPPVQVIQHVP